MQVAPQTRIIADGWAAYKGLEKVGFHWDWVNHKENFVKPGHPDIHTNTIEGSFFIIIYRELEK